MLKRLIEVALPLKEVSEQSAREKSIRHGHISTLHIWWARRPLAACRAAVFASLIPDPDDEECPDEFRQLVMEVLNRNEFKPKNEDCSTVEDTPRSRCLEFIKLLVRWENSNNPTYIEPAQKLIASAHSFLHPDSNDPQPKVLDPFAGGGAIPLEALRLGCQAHAVDLNPVAHLIELCTLVYPQKYGRANSRPVPTYIKRLIAHNKKQRQLKGAETASLFGDDEDVNEVEELTPEVDITENEYLNNPLLADFKYWSTIVIEHAWEEVWTNYGPSKEATRPSAFLWARIATCPNPSCQCEVPLIQSRTVASNGTKKTVLQYKFTGQEVSFDIKEIVNPSEEEVAGTLSRNAAVCLNCSTTIGKSELEKIGKSTGFGHKMMCVIESQGKGKTYRSPTEEDVNYFKLATEKLALNRSNQTKDGITIPDEELPYLRSIFNVHVYGINTWAKLFNDRQLLTLIALASAIRKASERIAKLHDEHYAIVIAGYLTLTLGRQADYSSTLCRWSPKGEFLADTFCRQALGMMWDHAEGNPFSTTTGNWGGAVGWISRVIEFLSSSPMSVGIVARGDATHTGYESSTLDCIVTDPPYYDAVPYANLSDFFYVWFRRVLGERMPDLFRTPLAPKGPELVQLAERNPIYKQKTKEFFEQGMKKAFEEGARILIPNGLYTVVYAHKSTAAWETLVNALIGAGLSVQASWPLHTERPGRMRSHDSAALASSVFLVCRKRPQCSTQGYWDDVRQELTTLTQERLDFFWNQGIRGADFFISAIGPALSVFGNYEQVLKLSGEGVTVAQFLDEVRSLVSNYALSKILKTSQTGIIDPESRFYVVWKWSYGETKVPADESFKLSQALGLDTERLWDRTGVLEKSGENVQAASVSKRMKINNLGEPAPEGTPASLIDVLHRMCAFRDKNDTQGMAQFLGRSGHANNPTLWLVAQAISEILPDGEKEKQLMQGLLNQRDGLEEATRQGELSFE